MAKPYGRAAYMGEFAGDAAALAFIRARLWDSSNDGNGQPQEGMSYTDTTLHAVKVYLNGAWASGGGGGISDAYDDLAAKDKIGSGADQVAAGDDARFTDARAPTAHAGTHATGGSDEITPADIGAAADDDARFPTSDEKAALAGTDGTPSATNPFVTDSDPRLDSAGSTYYLDSADDIQTYFSSADYADAHLVILTGDYTFTSDLVCGYDGRRVTFRPGVTFTFNNDSKWTTECGADAAFYEYYNQANYTTETRQLISWVAASNYWQASDTTGAPGAPDFSTAQAAGADTVVVEGIAAAITWDAGNPFRLTPATEAERPVGLTSATTNRSFAFIKPVRNWMMDGAVTVSMNADRTVVQVAIDWIGFLDCDFRALNLRITPPASSDLNILAWIHSCGRSQFGPILCNNWDCHNVTNLWRGATSDSFACVVMMEFCIGCQCHNWNIHNLNFYSTVAYNCVGAAVIQYYNYSLSSIGFEVNCIQAECNNGTKVGYARGVAARVCHNNVWNGYVLLNAKSADGGDGYGIVISSQGLGTSSSQYALSGVGTHKP